MYLQRLILPAISRLPAKLDSNHRLFSKTLVVLVGNEHNTGKARECAIV
jgi:hypothetical protein